MDKSTKRSREYHYWLPHAANQDLISCPPGAAALQSRTPAHLKSFI